MSGRYVQYLGFLQDLEQLVMAAQDAQVGKADAASGQASVPLAAEAGQDLLTALHCSVLLLWLGAVGCQLTAKCFLCASCSCA